MGAALTGAVVEVGPRTVSGPGSPPGAQVSAALDCIDDETALLDERPVAVSRLWGDVLGAAAGGHADALALVVPACWPRTRVQRIAEAGRTVTSTVVVLHRASLLADHVGRAVAELSDDRVALVRPGCAAEVFDRAELSARLADLDSVLVDTPVGVPSLPSRVVRQLRDHAVEVVRADPNLIRQAARAALPDGDVPPDDDLPPIVRRARRRAVAVLAGAAVSVGVVAAAQAFPGASPPDSAVLVEGRVAMRVPAQWTVQRNTSGPGSARLTVSAPGGDAALHLTQSTGPVPVTLPEVAESLRRALESEQQGIFDRFDPAGSAAGRPAVTYREQRAGSETVWSVLVDGAVRVAIGCQSPPGQADVIEAACAQAVQSAHIVP